MRLHSSGVMATSVEAAWTTGVFARHGVSRPAGSKDQERQVFDLSGRVADPARILAMAAAYRVPSHRSGPAVSKQSHRQDRAPLGTSPPHIHTEIRRVQSMHPEGVTDDGDLWPSTTAMTVPAGRPTQSARHRPSRSDRKRPSWVSNIDRGALTGDRPGRWRRTRLIDGCSRAAAVNSYKPTYRRLPTAGWKRAGQTVGRSTGVRWRHHDQPASVRLMALCRNDPMVQGGTGGRAVPAGTSRCDSSHWGIQAAVALELAGRHRPGAAWWAGAAGAVDAARFVSYDGAPGARGPPKWGTTRSTRLINVRGEVKPLVTSPTADSPSNLATSGEGGARGITLRCGRATASPGPCSVTLSYVPEPTVVKSVRLPRSLLDDLATRAELERRTFNNLVIKILAEALDGSNPASPAPHDKDKPA